MEGDFEWSDGSPVGYRYGELWETSEVGETQSGTQGKGPMDYIQMEESPRAP